MAIKATSSITISKERDVSQLWRFYRIAASTTTPSAPTDAQGIAYAESGTAIPNWSTVEPSYDGTSTNSLYICDLTYFSDGTLSWSNVSKSSSYEAAKGAYNLANNAITAANGKNKIFYQDAAPASGMSEGDLWFDTDGGNAIYEYKKTSSSPETYEWTLRQFGSGSIAAGSITANEINVANLSSIKANLGEITAGVLRSNTYTEASASSTYSTSGMKIDLNTMRIKTPKFAVTPSGVLYAKDADIAGNITADTGKIGGWDINSEQIRSDVTSGTTKYSAIQQSMNSSASTSRFAFAVVEYANGSTTYTDIPFRVNYDGSLLSTKGTIGGWTIGSSRLESTKTISGTIYDSYIQNMDGTDLTRGAFVLRNSTDGGTTWDYPFYVRYDGKFFASDATLTGDVTAKSLTVYEYIDIVSSGSWVPSGKPKARVKYESGNWNIASGYSKGSFVKPVPPTSVVPVITFYRSDMATSFGGLIDNFGVASTLTVGGDIRSDGDISGESLTAPEIYCQTLSVTNLALNPIALANGVNLNSYTTHGYYYYLAPSSSPSITNYPNGAVISNFTLQVQKKGNQCNQILINNSGEMYYRNQFTSSWSSWRKVTAVVV